MYHSVLKKTNCINKQNVTTITQTVIQILVVNLPLTVMVLSKEKKMKKHKSLYVYQTLQKTRYCF